MTASQLRIDDVQTKKFMHELRRKNDSEQADIVTSLLKGYELVDEEYAQRCAASVLFIRILSFANLHCSFQASIV